MTMSILLMMVVPALIAITAVVGAVLLGGRLSTSTRQARVGLWILIVALASLAFGIGACYAWFFFIFKLP